jgi:hypothetical protein
VERNQVKGSSDPPNNQLYPGEAGDVFTRLGRDAGTQSVLLTSRPLSSGLRGKCSRVANASDHLEEWIYVGDDLETAADRDRLIRVDGRSVDELTGSIASLVRQFRADQALSQGESTARIISIVLLHKILGSAAGAERSRTHALDIVKLISMPDEAIAHAGGSFDWGVPVSGIPTFTSTVPRLEILNALFAAIGNPSDPSLPNIAVATGQTGYGKSAVAADFCHIYRNAYEFLCWIDCSDPVLIESNIRRVTENLTRTPLPHRSDPSERFRAALASHRGPWLIVFDGVATRMDIEKFVPTQGNGAVLITSTNETGWWPSALALPIKTFTDAEAESCFASYAGFDSSVENPAVTDIVNRLGKIPLAISMAGLYFRNAAGTIGELSADYFAELDALADMGSIPPGFSRTAFAAIEHAVRNLGAGVSEGNTQDVRLAQALLYRASLLAPDLIPLNYLIAAVPESVTLRLGHLPEPSFAAVAVRRRYMSIFRTQSIAHRLLLLDDVGQQNEASETIEIHPLVHEILRRLFLRAIPQDRLQEQVGMMLNVLHGWIVHMRDRNAFFVVDQLVSHADSLLEVIAELGELPSVSPQHADMYRYTKIWLQLEVSTCRMSRGNLNASVNLARTALQELLTLPRNPAREALALQAVSSIIVDLSTAGSDPATVRPFAVIAQGMLLSCGSLGVNGARAAFEKAYLIRSFLKARVEYRQDPSIGGVIEAVEAVIARDPSDEVRPNAVMDHIAELIGANDLDAVDPLVAIVRESANVHDAVTLDCLEVDIALRRGQFDGAFEAIDHLLGMDLYESHLALTLGRGLGKVFQTLERTLAEGSGPTEQASIVLGRLRARAEQLHAQVLAESGGESHDRWK